MKGTQKLRQALADYLSENGLPAVMAWGEEKRTRPGKVMAAVSLRGLESGVPGFQDYLGERYDEATGQWVEFFGKKAELTFGLDLYGAAAEEVQGAVDALSLALGQGGPEGMRTVEWSAGEIVYQESARRYMCPVRAKFAVWMTAVAKEDGEFLDFEVKGENQA